MDAQSLKKFVENMRSQGMPDDEIERNLQIANHPQNTIDELLGKTPADMAAKEQRQDDAPIIDPNNRPQIIKARGGTLEAPSAPSDEGMVAATTAADEGAPSTKPKLEITPENPDLQPATIAAPAAPPQDVTSDEPEQLDGPDVAEETPAAPAPAPAPVGMPAPVSHGMPAPGQTAPEPTEAPAAASIYPDATRGNSAPPHPLPDHADPAAVPDDGTYPEYEANTFVLLKDSLISFVKHAPYMIAAIIFGIVLVFVLGLIFGLLGALLVGLVDENAVVGLGGISGGIGAIVIGIIIYAAVITLFLTLYRTIQLSIALDIAKGDKPDLGGAFNRLFTWFGRIFSVNFRLVIKLFFAGFVVGLVFLGIGWSLLSGNNYSGWDGLGLALLLFFAAYVVFIIMIIGIGLRNNFIQLLMLENGTNRPRDAAKDSIQLMKQPRRKYVDGLAWMFAVSALPAIFALVVAIASPTEYGSSSFESSTSVVEIISVILAYLISASFFAIYDIGLARQFWASRGLLRTAKPAPRFNWMTVIAIVATIAIYFGVGFTINSIEDQRYQDYLEQRELDRNNRDSNSGSNSLFESSSDDDFEFEFENDWDNNGIPDDQQCAADEFAFPAYVDFDTVTNEAIYEIECV